MYWINMPLKAVEIWGIFFSNFMPTVEYYTGRHKRIGRKLILLTLGQILNFVIQSEIAEMS